MHTLHTILNSFAILFSMTTATGLFVHDTNIDKATSVAFAAQNNANGPTPSKPGSDPHTHSERGSLYQAIRDLRASQPRIQPQRLGDKKHHLEKQTFGGRHAFDDYSLPIIG